MAQVIQVPAKVVREWQKGHEIACVCVCVSMSAKLSRGVPSAKRRESKPRMGIEKERKVDVVCPKMIVAGREKEMFPAAYVVVRGPTKRSKID